jgi:cytoskeletal protein CcmA (bactofilin family)
VEIPGTPGRRAGGAAGDSGFTPDTTDLRKLIVGRDISLSGEITSCDVLVVEGTVEAKLRDGRNIDIAESGLFKGSVEIDEADIAGRFEGDLTVRGRLRVRASGRINGSIRYGQLEVEAGGRLVGEIQTLSSPSEKAAGAPSALGATFAKAGGSSDAASLRSSAE